MSTENDQPKVFWKSSVPDPDNIDLDDLLNDRTEVNLDTEHRDNNLHNNQDDNTTPTKAKNNHKSFPKPSPLKQSLEVNSDMSKQEMM
tara:strand:+ start:112 stop:375 length:264 start_codon:yes stop_codon:yes gene_type:complete